MQPLATKATPASDDRRWKLGDATMRKHGNESAALVASLHTVQESFGYLDEVALRYVARSSRVPYSKVYGAARHGWRRGGYKSGRDHRRWQGVVVDGAMCRLLRAAPRWRGTSCVVRRSRKVC